MTPSRSPEWQAENKLMDCMAVLATVRDHVQKARRRIYNQAPPKQTFVELTAAVKELDELGVMWSACWEKVYSVAAKAGEEK